MLVFEKVKKTKMHRTEIQIGKKLWITEMMKMCGAELDLGEELNLPQKNRLTLTLQTAILVKTVICNM